MNSIKNYKKIRSEGIVHFWDLPNTKHTILKPSIKCEIMRKLMFVTKTRYNANKITGIPQSTMARYINQDMPKIRIRSLLRILDLIKFDVDTIEKSIVWVGDKCSLGIAKPKLPFNFNSRSGVHLLAAFCNDGWISDSAYYSNSDPNLRKSVKEDALKVFGGDDCIVREWIKDKDQYLSFISIIRDAVLAIADFKGIKSEKNPSVPPFILKNKELICGWIEQTIADEGNVKNYITGHREIIWTRSFKEDLPEYKLHLDELKMLDALGIKYTIHMVGRYKTAKGVLKIRKAIRIARRENLIKLRSLIKIPCGRKDKIFTDMFKRFVRYKEPLHIKETILVICKGKGYVTTPLLKEVMNYKNVGTGLKWIKLCEKEGMLKCVNRAFYPKRGWKKPAKYVLKQII